MEMKVSTKLKITLTDSASKVLGDLESYVSNNRLATIFTVDIIKIL